jgi:hypothetical protein
MASKIKVDNIENQCGGAVVTKCGATTTISGSVVKADDIQAADGGNLINQCGTTITLGASGDTINLASGASQTGFGRTGTVDWDTTKKTASFTAANGEGYFIDTSGGAVTMTLPASPSAGDIVAFKDYSGDFSTNSLTIGRNSSNLDGSAVDAVIDTNHTSMSLVYVDATQGWKSVEEGTGFIGQSFIEATGGTITTSGNCKIHTFTGPGTFCVSGISCTAANNVVSYVVVAGAGGGGGSALGYYAGGGGGAGGFREYKSPVTPYTSSPKDGNPGGTSITLTATAFPITVGAGGSGGAGSPGQEAPGGSRSDGSNGNNSVFSTITSTAGGGGGKSGSDPAASPSAGKAGGSGGGGGGYNSDAQGGRGLGNTPPTTPPQGFDGGTGNGPSLGRGGGGGGATSGGTAAPVHGAFNAPGGGGASSCISASPVPYGVGGNAGAQCNSAADVGTANRGDGGQGGNNFGPNAGGGNGGSGVVIIRYKYQ